MRCCCAALMRTFACLAFSMFAVGCGALAADDAKTEPEPEPERVPNPPTAKVAPSCTRARTAPLVAVDDVESGSTKVGPCGDVVFRKTDGSLWLRAASGDGALVALTPAGQPGDFDVTGRYLSYARTDSKDAVLRDLESGAETVLPVAASFGFDAEAGAPIVFTCGDGVRVLHADGTLGPVLAAGHVCGDRGLAPYGKKQLLFGDADAVVVDLARETILHLDVDYVSSPGLGTARRGDELVISKDGGVVLHQIATWTPCGDTECSDADGYDIVSTTTGKRTQHAGRGSLPLSHAFDYAGARANALLEGRGRAASIDTSTGVYVERADATCIRLQEDGTLVLLRSDASGTRVTTARPGETQEQDWFSAGTRPTSVVAWPTGKRVLVLERTQGVKADSGGTWAGSENGDLVVKDESGAEIGRHPYFTDVEPVAFSADGAVVLLATRYASAPPASAASSDALGLVSSLVRVAADGSLESIMDHVMSSDDVIELDDRSIAVMTRSEPGSYTIYDLALSSPRKTIAGPYLRAVTSSWSPGVVVLEDVTSADWQAPAKLWHGVADR